MRRSLPNPSTRLAAGTKSQSGTFRGSKLLECFAFDRGGRQLPHHRVEFHTKSIGDSVMACCWTSG